MSTRTRIIRIHPRPEPQAESLFDFVEPAKVSGQSIQERFEEFDRANPWVRRELIRLAHELIEAQRRRGREPKIGVKALIERLRWDWEVSTTSKDGWKINNDYTSRYARLLCDLDPELANAIETRRLLSA